jgi:hypothetical protein
VGRLDSRTQADEAAWAIRAQIGAAIAQFDFKDNGSLRMRTDSITIAVEPAYDFEAWHATGPPPEKHMIICQPGGGIA